MCACQPEGSRSTEVGPSACWGSSQRRSVMFMLSIICKNLVTEQLSCRRGARVWCSPLTEPRQPPGAGGPCGVVLSWGNGPGLYSPHWSITACQAAPGRRHDQVRQCLQPRKTSKEAENQGPCSSSSPSRWGLSLHSRGESGWLTTGHPNSVRFRLYEVPRQTR